MYCRYDDMKVGYEQPNKTENKMGYVARRAAEFAVQYALGKSRNIGDQDNTTAVVVLFTDAFGKKGDLDKKM